MPDIDTGERGTGIVYTVKLQFDVNHDGTMDLSYGGPDNTMNGNGDSYGTIPRPFVFWRNDNYDRNTKDADDGVPYDDDVLRADSPGSVTRDTPDFDYRNSAGHRVIPCTRDVQDFARLWICGVTTNLLAALPVDSTVTLSIGANPAFSGDDPTTGNPTIDLFVADDSDGGIGYLTNRLTANFQLESPYVGRLGIGQSIQLNTGPLAGYLARGHFLFCGVSNGFGEITLTIADDNGNVLGQTRSYIEIKEIKQMYERWTVGDDRNKAPKTKAIVASDNFAPDGGMALPFKYDYNANTDTNSPYILYVHGWNMKPWEKDRFAESAFKRLYWQGYQGRFGTYRWPTGNGFTGWKTAITDPDNYDDSEYIAWRSAVGLSNKLTDLNMKYPGHVYMLAHSMGNVVAGEALRLAGTNRIVNTYVASQAAIPSHVYDNTVPDYSFTFTLDFGPKTPNIYKDWLSTNSAAVGRRVNFANTNDYALSRPHWELDQLLKPDQSLFGWSYFFDGYPHDGDSNYNPGAPDDTAPWNYFFKQVPFGDPSYFDIVNVTTNRYEVMAYAAQSRSPALGATPVATLSASVDLTQIWPPDPNPNFQDSPYSEHFYHSAQFRGRCWEEWKYWNTLLRSDTEGFDIQN